MNLHRPRRPTLSGVTAAVVAVVAAALLACAGCGGSSAPSSGSTGAQGSGTSTSQPAAPTQPAAPKTSQPAAPANGMNGACGKITLQTVKAALGGPITASDATSWTSASAHSTLQCDTSPTQYPSAITGDYTRAIPDGVTSPCTDGVFALGGGSPFVGAFCPGGDVGFVGMTLQTDTEPAGSSDTFYPISPAQVSAVAQAMRQAIG